MPSKCVSACVHIANKVLLLVNLDCQGNACKSIKCVSLIITNNCFRETNIDDLSFRDTHWHVRHFTNAPNPDRICHGSLFVFLFCFKAQNT